MKRSTPSPEIALLLQILDQAFASRSWHGPNLRGSIRGLDPAAAFWRPDARRHSIWDLVIHCAYWKYRARRRLDPESGSSFPLGGSNWFATEEQTAAAWRRAVALVASEHLALREVVESLPGGRLSDRLGRWTVGETIAGVAAHDLYHAGQIQLLKRLQNGT